MMSFLFSQLIPELQFLQVLAAVLLLLLHITVLARCIMIRRGFLMTAATLISTGLCGIVFLVTLHASRAQGPEDGAWAYRMINSRPDILWISAMVLLAIIAVMLLVDLASFKKSKYPDISIKEAVDTIPTGMCYYNKNGRVILVNELMNDISYHICGSPVLSGTELWRSISSDNPAGNFTVLPSDTGRILLFPDGRAFNFLRQPLTLDGAPIYEVLAVNVSDEYKLSLNLRTNHERLVQQRDHLLKVGGIITDLAIQREVYNAKTRMHDDLGNILIATRQYLSGAPGISKDTLLRLWRKSMVILHREDTDDADPYDYGAVLKAARDVGISVIVRGDLPQEAMPKAIVACALRECITNTVRHSEGDMVSVRVTPAEGGGYSVSIANNAMPTNNHITETRGLKYLREMTEKSGGTMIVSNSPTLTVTLRVPGGGNDTYSLGNAMTARR